ncbi:MAG: hypothetical protein LBJ16_02285 [Holosporaceae bacterium]|nr:hypothetical protein [Holosporaceae bacterium]
MSNEEVSLLEEINEELQHDRQMMFFKKHKEPILYGIAVIAVGILTYSSWYIRKQRHLEDMTNALMSIGVGTNNSLMLEKLADDAPMELKPILMIMKSGGEMMASNFSSENLAPLLELANRSGVDIIWQDLALLVYASYPVKAPDELIRLLSPLTGDDRPFRFTAMELIGVIKEQNGEHDAALEIFSKIIERKDVPETLKRRISMMSSYIKNSREKH